MPLGIRIFLVYFLFVGLAGFFVLSTVMDEIRPGIRQSTEETLVDTANLLAEMLTDVVKSGILTQSRWRVLFERYGQRAPQAKIWDVNKSNVSNRIYVTDRHGKVLLDSSGKAVGEDYSRWNDVYLTLQGKYGARSSQEIPGDASSTVMYVAAPIMDGSTIIGVVSVGKPSKTVQPYIDRAKQRLGVFGVGLILLGLLIGGVLSWWLSKSIRRLTAYAQDVSVGKRAVLPHYRGGEFARLTRALETMREQLDGKAYVERYVQTLTHELKSPLTAIRGAAELLHGEAPVEQRQRFAGNIIRESDRVQQLIERLLNLAQVEQREGLEERVAIPLRELTEELLQAHATRIMSGNIHVDDDISASVVISGERFLLRQALANLLDNAIDFTPPGGKITLRAHVEGQFAAISVINEGSPIPDYALSRVTERFYSLPRPGRGHKSTGLGLNFVQEAATLHGGFLRIVNTPDGVAASLLIPLATK